MLRTTIHVSVQVLPFGTSSCTLVAMPLAPTVQPEESAPEPEILPNSTMADSCS